MTTYEVGYLIGSLRTESINRILAQALMRVAPPALTFREIPIGGPGALQRNAPEAYIQFKPDVFAPVGTISDPSTEAFLRDFMAAFEQFIVRVLTVLPR